MATTHSTTVADMAKLFSDRVRDQPAAKQLWFRQFGPVAEIWLIADAEDLEVERNLRAVGLELYSAFPNQLIDFQLINLALSASDARSRIPHDADSIVLH